MAIGETPSEPLIALMNHALGAGHSHKKEIAKIAGTAKIETKGQDLCHDPVFLISVISENQW